MRFFNGKAGKYSKVVVSGHLDLIGYIVKMYLDSNLDARPEIKFKERILGAIAVKRCIDEYHLHDLIKVPKKWIYPIPEFPDSGENPQHFVLIAEDVSPYPFEKI